tara:strand:+ start:4807 stop:6153 length:1347 start_codon:yes stop_codon:yes gene_type:complete
MHNNNHIEKFLLKVKSKNTVVGIVGLGYVGLPLGLRFVEEGFQTIGFDLDNKKVDSINNGKSYIDHISDDKILTAKKNGFKATVDYKNISKVDAIIICVPTPLGVHNEPDLSYIYGTLNLLKPYLKHGQLLVLESTTYPGTTEEEIVPSLEETSRQRSKDVIPISVGKNFFVGYSPEREDPGNQKFNTQSIPKVISGFTDDCLECVKSLYGQIIDETVPVSSPRVAEMTKVLENIHRAVNIGLVNELKIVTEKMDIDIYEVIDAAATKPFGFTPFYPGPGLGGHCIPIDPFYLTWKAKEYGMNTRFIELAGEINTSMPAYVVERTADALNDIGKSIKSSKILALGLSYKKNVDDLRESPSLEILEKLDKKGASIDFSDPFFTKIPSTRKYSFKIKSVEVSKDSLLNYDLVILLTDHDEYDYELIEEYAKMIIDTRGKFNNKNKKVRKA